MWYWLYFDYFCFPSLIISLFLWINLGHLATHSWGMIPKNDSRPMHLESEPESESETESECLSLIVNLLRFFGLVCREAPLPCLSSPDVIRLLALPPCLFTDCSLTCSSGWQTPTERGERMAQGQEMKWWNRVYEATPCTLYKHQPKTGL